MQKERIFWIDALRGLAILAMLVYHAVFNLLYFANVSAPRLASLLESRPVGLLHDMFLAVFLGLAGICSHLTRRPFLRAGKVMAGALAITAVTFFAMRDDRIVFGILHCMAVCMFLEALLHRALLRIPPIPAALVFFLAALLLWHVPDGYIGFEKAAFFLPRSWYGDLLLPLGLPPVFFSSLDYVPLLPYGCLFFCGVFIGRLRLPQSTHRLPFLEFVGRHSLAIYLLHQPILLGFCMLIAKWG